MGGGGRAYLDLVDRIGGSLAGAAGGGESAGEPAGDEPRIIVP